MAAMLVTAGCNASSGSDSGSSGDENPTSRLPPASSASQGPLTDSATVARKAATAAYLGMWSDMAKAAQTSDWKSPLLSQHATGDALSAISRGMYADHANGLVTKGQPRNSPSVSSVAPAGSPTTVMMSDCGDSSHWLKYRKADGKPVDSAPGGRQTITAEVKRLASGVWKVTRFAVEAVGSC